MRPDLPRFLAQRAATGRLDVHHRELEDEGVSLPQLRVWLRAGYLARVTRGVYVIQVPLPGEDAWSRARALYVRRCGAVVAGIPRSYLVGPSAAAAHGLPLLAEPSVVHIARKPYCRNVRPGLVVHRPWSKSPPTLASGIRAMSVAECIVDVSAACGVEAGLVVADAAAHLGAVTSAQMQAALADYGSRRGVSYARWVAQIADPRTESPGETRLRWILRGLGHVVVPQVEVLGETGEFVARVDFLVEGTNVIVEFDGMGKYAKPEDLRAEKRRQMDLERLGYIVRRFRWSDLDHPARIDRVLREALALDRFGRLHGFRPAA